MENKQLFYINSRNRLSGSNSDFQYEIPIINDYSRVAVLYASIPRSYYLVNTNYNTFTLTEGVLSATITLPVGNYSQRGLKTKLITLLNAASPNLYTYNVTYDNPNSGPDTGKFTFSVTAPASQPSFTFTTNLTEILGFNNNTTYTFVANSLTAANVCKLQSEDTIFIHSDIVDGEDILQEIYTTDAPTMSAIVYQATEAQLYSKRLHKNESKVFRFTITNEDKETLETNGINILITLVLF